METWRKVGATSVVTLLSVLALSALTVMAGPPQTGDWVVDATTVETDADLVLDGNLIVRSGGHLTLRNVTLRIKDGPSGPYDILVTDGSSLTLEESIILPEQPGKGYSLVVEGQLVLTDSVIEGLWGDGGDEEGLMVVDGSLTMTGSTVRSSKGTGIFLERADATIEDSEVTGNGGTGIYMTGVSSPRIVGTNITNNGGHGLVVDGMASPEVLDSLIADNGRDGVHIEGASPSFADNVVKDNKGHGISAVEAVSLNLDEDIIVGNSGWGVLSVRGPMNLKAVVFEKDGSANSLGRTSQAWSLSVFVEGSDGVPRVDVEVMVTSSKGVVHGPTLTNDDGLALFDNLVADRLWNNGTTRDENPYTVKVTLKDDDTSISKVVEVDLDGNTELPVTVDQADLALSNLHMSDVEVTKGDDVEVSVVVTNIGGVEPGEFSVIFYDGSKIIKKRSIEGLEPGTSREIAINWRTGDQASGNHKIRVVVDPEDDVPETDERNNELSSTIELVDSKIMTYAIPILIIFGVIGLAGFKLYGWILMKRLENKQKRKKRDEVDFVVMEEVMEKEEE